MCIKKRNREFKQISNKAKWPVFWWFVIYVAAAKIDQACREKLCYRQEINYWLEILKNQRIFVSIHNFRETSELMGDATKILFL